MNPLPLSNLGDIAHVIQLAVAFIDAFLTMNLAKLMGALFVLAMLALIASLGAFLREIFLALDSARQAMRRRTGA